MVKWHSDAGAVLSWHRDLCLLLIIEHMAVLVTRAQFHKQVFFCPAAPGQPIILPPLEKTAGHKGQLVSMTPVHSYSCPYHKVIARIPCGQSYVWSLLPFPHLYLLFYVDLSFSVPPAISEAELSAVDVQPYPFDKQHQLTCTAYGLSLPNITWFWQPCHSDNISKK